jgi:type I restriction enzyme S subunit
MARLGDVCVINPKIPVLNDNFLVSFVPMSEVSETGHINPSEVCEYQEVKKGFTGFLEGDVLFAKISPCMENGKGAIARGLNNGVGFGSTEFHVLRPNSDVLLSDWLYYLLSWPTFRKDAEKNMTGSAGQKRVPKLFIENYQVHIPDLKEQQRQVMLLCKIDHLINLRKQQLAKLDELVKARFVEMFGDPISNSMGLPEMTLPELGEFGRGVSKHRPRNDPELLGGIYPLIQTGEVASADLYITSYENTYSELGFRQSKMWDKGTLCITIAANIAKTAILGFDACFPDSVVGFNANEKTCNIFIHYWFSFFQAILESQAPESAQKNINLKILSELKVIVPPIDNQQAFSNFVEQVYKSKLAIQQGLEKLELLKKALMQKYFG